MSAPARVLVVDDSLTMRSMIASVLGRDPDIAVVGQASDAMEARSAIKSLNPDVVTLDIEMPNMNGLEFLEKIMRLRPMPVIMVSTLTQRGADASLAALEIGAFDCVGKPAPGDAAPFADLVAKVKAAAHSKLRREPASPARPSEAAIDADYRPRRKVIAIGASTGGVEALIQVLSRFPANCPPTVVTQHMPGSFTRSFAERLDRLCAPKVAEARDGEALSFGRVYLAPGGNRHLEIVNPSAPQCRLAEGSPVNGHCPSVDVLFSSVAETAGKNAIGAILTGMGRDGAEGLLKMHRAGAATLGQNERSCVVYGMPRVAFEIGAVGRQLPLEAIGQEIISITAAKPVGSA
ncbi:protein-glutamate methylesterase/protein-glutamine glutaminase [Pararhizobium haloflavum]|uniref:protein-glutamate methylesterase/protein-glutamine glutaminase n=1 Tax=Pararhizobium haloflavum TaxID=2037914 RepID=UPI000C182C89|nr:chemotaxis response regulator protein-glutamate methylesterase [Pararhizobium haloflavum]